MNHQVEQLPSLNDQKKISASQISVFRENGHILIPDILNQEEVTIYRGVIEDAVKRFNTEKRKLEDRDTYSKAFLQVMNLWQQDERAKNFVFAKRLGRIAADLLGVENVRIYHDQALFKEPGGGPTPWHQDQYYWPIDTEKTVTMWMPLVDINVDMGMLTFASGSHNDGVIFDYEISDESEEEFTRYLKEGGFPITRSATMNSGDTTWHYGCTVHSAPGNKSNKAREIMTIIYFADGAKITHPANKWQVNDHKKWLMNIPVGQLAASERNPLVL